MDVEITGDPASATFRLKTENVLVVRHMLVWAKGAREVLWRANLSGVPKAIRYGSTGGAVSQVYPLEQRAPGPVPERTWVFVNVSYNYDARSSAKGGLRQLAFRHAKGVVEVADRQTLEREFEPPP